MSGANWLQLIALIALLFAATPILGRYMAAVFGAPETRADSGGVRGGENGTETGTNSGYDDEALDLPKPGQGAPGDRIFLPIERVIYRLTGVDEHREQRWQSYAYAVLAFSAFSALGLYLLQRIQGWLPLNPTRVVAVPAALAFNTSVSFVTNTNWQNYVPESTVSNLTQMSGLAVQNFVSAAVGLAVAIALVRGLTRRQSATIGNFWVDLTRGTVRILLPLALIFAVIFVSQGVVQNLHGFTAVSTVEGAQQAIAGGPLASQEAIKQLGTNGGGSLNANSTHPFENPTSLTNLMQIFLLLVIPFALTYTFGRFAKNQRQGWTIFAAMFALWIASALIAQGFETAGNSRLDALGVTQAATAQQGGGNMEGKEVRFGSASCGLYAASTTGTSTGAVDCFHDSMTAGGGAVPLVNMMLGEVSPGGVGAGLYGMLVFAILSVFIAGLMVGRTPEYLGKKIQAAEMKLIVLYILAVPFVVLGLTAASVVMRTPQASILNPGPHGLTEVVYAFTSASNNNGSAFGGLTGNTDWYNTTLGLSMLAGRFLLIVPALAIAGALARKPTVPASAGTFPTDTPLFAGLLTGLVVIVVGLTYFPVVTLGPVVEQLSH